MILVLKLKSSFSKESSQSLGFHAQVLIMKHNYIGSCLNGCNSGVFLVFSLIALCKASNRIGDLGMCTIVMGSSSGMEMKMNRLFIHCYRLLATPNKYTSCHFPPHLGANRLDITLWWWVTCRGWTHETGGFTIIHKPEISSFLFWFPH